MTKGEIETAQRRALNLLDQWISATGVIPQHSGYYYELQSVIEDAVHCGAQQALGIHRKLDSEK